MKRIVTLTCVVLFNLTATALADVQPKVIDLGSNRPTDIELTSSGEAVVSSFFYNTTSGVISAKIHTVSADRNNVTDANVGNLGGNGIDDDATMVLDISPNGSAFSGLSVSPQSSGDGEGIFGSTPLPASVTGIGFANGSVESGSFSISLSGNLYGDLAQSTYPYVWTNSFGFQILPNNGSVLSASGNDEHGIGFSEISGGTPSIASIWKNGQHMYLVPPGDEEENFTYARRTSANGKYIVGMRSYFDFGTFDFYDLPTCWVDIAISGQAELRPDLGFSWEFPLQADGEFFNGSANSVTDNGIMGGSTIFGSSTDGEAWIYDANSGHFENIAGSTASHSPRLLEEFLLTEFGLTNPYDKLTDVNGLRFDEGTGELLIAATATDTGGFPKGVVFSVPYAAPTDPCATATDSGTSGDDTMTISMTGRSGELTICSLGGNDTVNFSGNPANITKINLYTGNGDDTVNVLISSSTGVNIEAYLGAGNDSFIGRGNKAFTVYGEGEIDTVLGGLAGDTIFGGPGADYLRGLNGNDYIDGGDDNDKIRGENHDDILLGGQGIDYIYGLNGNDILDGGTENDVMLGGNGNDIVMGREGADRLYANIGIDFIFAEAGNDYLFAGDTACTGAITCKTVMSGYTGADRLTRLGNGQHVYHGGLDSTKDTNIYGQNYTPQGTDVIEYIYEAIDTYSPLATWQSSAIQITVQDFESDIQPALTAISNAGLAAPVY